MDEFAQSREDDDLFADEFEPLAEPTTTIEPAIEAPRPAERGQQRHNTLNESRGGHRNNRGHDSRRGRGGRGGGGAHQNGLGQSRYAPQNESKPAAPKPVQAAPAPVVPAPATEPEQIDPERTNAESQEAAPQSPPATENTIPQGPAQSTPARIPAVRGDRSATGGPAHKKLTEEELTAKLEKMAILNAQKSAKHRAQEADQAAFQHREKELAKERREKLSEEKKNRSQMEAERAKNRLRKIQAQGVREWDSEKVEDDIVDGRRARTSEYVRGGHGGVKRGGLAGSRYAEGEDAPEEMNGGRGRGGFEVRGRGRGGRGGGRGGKASGPQQIPTPDDFPSLPPSKVLETKEDMPKPAESTEPLPMMGEKSGEAWADEMATPVEPVEDKKEITT